MQFVRVFILICQNGYVGGKEVGRPIGNYILPLSLHEWGGVVLCGRCPEKIVTKRVFNAEGASQLVSCAVTCGLIYYETGCIVKKEKKK